MKTLRPNITTRTNPGGTTSFVVDAGLINGKRYRRFFSAKADADKHARELKGDHQRYQGSAQHFELSRHIAESKTRFWELTSPNVDREDVRKISAAMREYYDQLSELFVKVSEKMRVASSQWRITKDSISKPKETTDLYVNFTRDRIAKFKTFDEEINRLK